jgi:hypothetical protein
MTGAGAEHSLHLSTRLTEDKLCAGGQKSQLLRVQADVHSTLMLIVTDASLAQCSTVNIKHT